MLVLVGVPIGVPIPPIIISDGQHTPLFAMIPYNRCREHNNIGSNATVSLREDHNRPHSLMTLSIDLDNLMITPPQYIWPRPRLPQDFSTHARLPFPHQDQVQGMYLSSLRISSGFTVISFRSAYFYFFSDLKNGICSNSDHRQKSFNCKNIL